MFINPSTQAFQATIEAALVGYLNSGGEYCFSSPINDPSTVHVAADAFYTAFLRAAVSTGYPFFIHDDGRFGLVAVFYQDRGLC